MSLRFVVLLGLIALGALGLASCSPGNETEVATLPEAAAEPTSEALDHDVADADSGAASAEAAGTGETAESAPTSGDSIVGTEDAGAKTDGDAPSGEDTMQVVEEPQPEIAAPTDMNDDDSSLPPEEGVAEEAPAPHPTESVEPTEPTESGEPMEPAEPTRADGADSVAVEAVEPVETAELPQDAVSEATAYWKPVADPEDVAPPSEPEAVVREERVEPVGVVCESSAEAEGYIAVVENHICAAEPKQRDPRAATLRDFEGAFAAGSGGISYRLTIFDAEDDTAHGSFDSTDAGTSDCAVELVGDSIRLVFADLSEMTLLIVGPDALGSLDYPVVLRRE